MGFKGKLTHSKRPLAVIVAPRRHSVVATIEHLGTSSSRADLRVALSGAVEYVLTAMARVETDWSDDWPADPKGALKAAKDALDANPGCADADAVFAEVSPVVAEVSMRLLDLGDQMWARCIANEEVTRHAQERWAAVPEVESLVDRGFGRAESDFSADSGAGGR
jgi:hypothetical protein